MTFATMPHVSTYHPTPERPLTPPDDVVVGYCSHCGGEIYKGEEILTDSCTALHPECLKPWVADLGREALMEFFGFTQEVADDE